MKPRRIITKLRLNTLEDKHKAKHKAEKDKHKAEIKTLADELAVIQSKLVQIMTVKDLNTQLTKTLKDESAKKDAKYEQNLFTKD